MASPKFCPVGSRPSVSTVKDTTDGKPTWAAACTNPMASLALVIVIAVVIIGLGVGEHANLMSMINCSLGEGHDLSRIVAVTARANAAADDDRGCAMRVPCLQFMHQLD